MSVIAGPSFASQALASRSSLLSFGYEGAQSSGWSLSLATFSLHGLDLGQVAEVKGGSERLSGQYRYFLDCVKDYAERSAQRTRRTP